MNHTPGTCYQVNMQRHFGGGEVYTGFLTRALLACGYKVLIFVHHQADFWHQVDLGDAELIPLEKGDQIPGHLPVEPGLLLFHGPAARKLSLPGGWHTIAIAHMPVYDRSVSGFRVANKVLGVSQHVIDSLHSKEIKQTHPIPLLGVADLRSGQADAEITEHSRYDWDERKVRDRLLSHLHPWYQRIKPARRFEPDPGTLTLGLVSRITPIKQFDTLFRHLAPIIARYPQVRLEIFGAGGYASIRDLREALAPMKNQVRWWGHQSNVRAIYARLDYLLTGLPEKEALGLNVLEAQQVGLPVLAVGAPPFTETVLDGQSGWLYADPRPEKITPGLPDFDTLLTDLLSENRNRPSPKAAQDHLALFSFGAFQQRIATVFADLFAELHNRTPES